MADGSVHKDEIEIERWDNLHSLPRSHVFYSSGRQKAMQTETVAKVLHSGE